MVAELTLAMGRTALHSAAAINSSSTSEPPEAMAASTSVAASLTNLVDLYREEGLVVAASPAARLPAHHITTPITLGLCTTAR
jgi:hypothetical protein